MNLLSIQELSKEKILELIERSLFFKNNPQSIPSFKVPMMNIFLEPSTRTLISFQKAERNLGLDIYNLDLDSSSFVKGETLLDTLLNVQSMGINTFVIRSSEESYWKDFEVHNFNIINAGDGKTNHPTQALLDAMTIFEHFGRLSDLKVLVCGDIKHSRVYSSLKQLLQKFNSQVHGIGPKVFGGADERIQDWISDFDVIVMLRVQHERHEDSISISEYNRDFGLNEGAIKKMKSNSIFLHPGPVNRGVEIEENILYSSHRSKILEQVKNGVYIRTAILELVCKNI